MGMQDDEGVGDGSMSQEKRDYLFDSTFSCPVTVATVDQMLSTMLNTGKWAVKMANFANSVVVVDEVHAYDPRAMGLLVSSMKHLSKIGTRFLLMSATMPKELIKLFEREICIKKVIREKSLQQASRSQYFVLDQEIDFLTDEIRQAVLDGHKTLVVVNTVKKAQELTVKMADLNPRCFHSMFTVLDRKCIESELEEGKYNFVIATQAIEVSLDIDYDWLFTECAPADAVFQRAGRVNRYRSSTRDSRVFICKPSNATETIYSSPINPLLIWKSYKTFKANTGRIKEEDVQRIVDDVYSGYEIEKEKGYTEAIDVVNSIMRDGCVIDSPMGEESLQTRQVEYVTVSVVPACFASEVKTDRDRKMYEVKVPLWYWLKHKLDDGFCDMQYSDKLGGVLAPGC